MTKDEALKLALGALSDIPIQYRNSIEKDAIAAVREALAQPKQRLKQVAHIYLLDAKGWPKVGWDDGRGIKVGDKLYTLVSTEELLAELISASENTSIPRPEKNT